MPATQREEAFLPARDSAVTVLLRDDAKELENIGGEAVRDWNRRAAAGDVFRRNSFRVIRRIRASQQTQTCVTLLQTKWNEADAPGWFVVTSYCGAAEPN